MEFHTHRKIQGFTLIELMVVLTIGVALTGIAVKSASDLAFVARYEQTSEMADRIKSAIIGRPGRYINGQPDTSGYVADIGRTPEYLRDLLQAGYCKTSTGVYVEHKSEASCKAINVTHSWDWADTPCLKKSDTTNTTVTNEVSCTPTADYVWIGVGFDTATNLKYGWNGPYLQTSKQANNNSALEDGWGNGTENKNYGWQVSNAGSTFSVKSKGKDQSINADGCLIYENDCAYEVQGNEYVKNIGTLPLTITINTDESSLPSYVSPTSTGFCTETDSTTYPDQTTCNAAANRDWDSSISKCLITHDGEPEASCNTSIARWDTTLNLCLQTLASSTEDNCITVLSNKWELKIVTPAPPTFPNQKVCMRVFYRLDGTITPILSTNQPSIVRDGTSQDVIFNFAPENIPNSLNAIGIYSYGTCSDTTYTMQKECVDNSGTWDTTSCSNNSYPANHASQHVTFAPYKTIDNLVW